MPRTTAKQSLRSRLGFKDKEIIVVSTAEGRKVLSKRAGSSKDLAAPARRDSGHTNGLDKGLPPLPKARLDTAGSAQEARDLQRSIIDKDTGERKDVTDLLHSLTFDDSVHHVDSEKRLSLNFDSSRPSGAALLASLSAELWTHIARFLDPDDAANLALSSRILLGRFGDVCFRELDRASNKTSKIKFLLRIDSKLPSHLLCFVCCRYHVRLQPGKESLKPANVLNPVFRCDNATNAACPPSRLRITPGRVLPFTFAQLVMRAHKYTPESGISLQSLGRRWKDAASGWNHVSQYYIHRNDHLLMRVVSQVHVDAGLTLAAQRLLLYSREDYTPYFSVCAHWRDGVLMKSCKCALDHIPVPRTDVYHSKLRPDKLPGFVSLCGECRPIRRCPLCPTEYLVELKLVEDKDAPRASALRFKQALLVTRWSDLGDCTTPYTPEWTTINGTNKERYDSFAEIGTRAVSGIFESAMSGSIPGQRILSMNPDGIDKGEAGHDWY